MKLSGRAMALLLLSTLPCHLARSTDPSEPDIRCNATGPHSISSGRFWADLKQELTGRALELHGNEILDRLSTVASCLASKLDDINETVGVMSTTNESVNKNTRAIELNTETLQRQLEQSNATLHSLSDRLGATKLSLPCDQCETPTPNNTEQIVKVVQQQALLLQSIDHSLTAISRRANSAVWSPTAIDDYFSNQDSVASKPKASMQIDPTLPIRSYYPGSQLTLEIGILTLPDPRVPRHIRQYDNAIAAVNQAMLTNGYVLDRYGFPWLSDIDKQAPLYAQPRPEGTSPVIGKLPTYRANDDRYGLLIYRQDQWRHGKGSGIDLRALYVIPETATYGVQTAAFTGALKRLTGEIASGGKMLRHPACRPWEYAQTDMPVTVFGPVYSGSLDSIREITMSSGMSFISKHICVLSPTATASSNSRADITSILVPITHPEAAPGSEESKTYVPPALRFVGMAANDADKLDFVAKFARGLFIDPSKIALVYESTVFGSDLCARDVAGRTDATYPLLPDKDELCDKALKIPFPVNIADVRFGVREQEERRRTEAQRALHIPNLDKTLELEEGAENGSEFPESQQSPLTGVGTQMIISNIIAFLRERHAEMIVVVATDVRDRLFLFDQINAINSRALLVDLGTDLLLAHPSVINSTRGLLTVGASRLELSPDEDVRPGGASILNPAVLTSWSTDDQALTFKAIKAWSGDQQGLEVAAVRPYVVTRNGLVTMDDKIQTRSSHGHNDGADWLAPWNITKSVVVIAALMALATSIYYAYHQPTLDAARAELLLILQGVPLVSVGNQSSRTSTWLRVMFLAVAAILVSALTGQYTLSLVAFALLLVRPSWRIFQALRWSTTMLWLCITLLGIMSALVLFLSLWSRDPPSSNSTSTDSMQVAAAIYQFRVIRT